MELYVDGYRRIDRSNSNNDKTIILGEAVNTITLLLYIILRQPQNVNLSVFSYGSFLMIYSYLWVVSDNGNRIGYRRSYTAQIRRRTDFLEELEEM